MALAPVLPLDDPIDRAFDAVLEQLRACPLDDALARGQRFQSGLLALEAELLAGRVAEGATARHVENLAGRSGKVSKRDAKKRALRAKAVEVNPALADAVAAEELSSEALDALADVSAKTDGAAATDQWLIDRLKAGAPDDARVTVREWLDDHTTSAENEARWQRQRRQRKLSKFTTRRGTDAIFAEGDTETIAEMWTALTVTSDALYRADGGRDTEAARHPRTRDQRLYDALYQTITANVAQQGDTGDGRAAARRQVPPQVFITMTIDDWIDDPTRARLAGGGSIPKALLDDYLTDATIAGILFDGDGHILWHGRNRRYATLPQQNALTARDQGCALCHAHPSACEAHHLIPYNAPAQGKTNTGELALVCTDCHHHIHHNKLTLVAQPDPAKPGTLTWKLRPATPDEIPP